MNKALIIAILTAVSGVFSGSYGNIIFTDLGSDQYRVQIDPVSFEITSAGKAIDIVIEDFFSTPATAPGYWVSGGVTWQRNSDSAISLDATSATGVFHSEYGELSTTDLFVNYATAYFDLNLPVLEIGDTVTVSADFIFTVSFIPERSTADTYTAGLLDESGNFMTAHQTVPEPTTAALLSITAIGIMAFRRIYISPRI